MWTSVPNQLTVLRIALVPALVGAFFLEGDIAHWLALGIFLFASLTDFFDGYFARAWHQQSKLGQMLDPIADKLLVAAALLMLVSTGEIGGISVLAAIVILSREILVSGLREYLATLRVSVPVTQLAKWKTGMQMTALAFLLGGDAADKIFAFTTTIGLAGIWLAAVLTLYTGYDYFKAGMKHMVEDASTAPPPEAQGTGAKP